MREALKDFLEFHDFAVTAVDSAAQALQIVIGGDFDLVISDLVMPRMDGIALIKAIREAGKDVPLLVMTGFASIEYAVESMKAGATDFITKPLKFDHVMLIINRVLETSALRQMAREREYYKDLSNSDGLTQIGNYRHFNHVLQVEIDRQRRYHRPLTLLMIDIDDFKKTNDRYGHLIGDMVLIKIAALLKDEVRGFDFVARYGGDEFTVILPEVSEKAALAVGRRIMKSIGLQDFRSPEYKEIGQVSVTIGIASFPKDADEARTWSPRPTGPCTRGKARARTACASSATRANIIRLRRPTRAAGRRIRNNRRRAASRRRSRAGRLRRPRTSQRPLASRWRMRSSSSSSSRSASMPAATRPLPESFNMAATLDVTTGSAFSSGSFSRRTASMSSVKMALGLPLARLSRLPWSSNVGSEPQPSDENVMCASGTPAASSSRRQAEGLISSSG